jgi:putative transposase
MAKPRVFTHPDTQTGVYHIVSRIVDRQFLFGEAEKDTFVRMMHAFAAFHQVQILTYCVMSNHFHLLVRVPKRPEGFDLSFEEVLARWQSAVGDAWQQGMQRQFEIFRSNGSEAAIEEWRQRMLGRMYSLSEFMKALKQRFSQWYNRRAGRQGTLWEGRYQSVIVQDENRALRTMSTYIDLNPVRAGIVDDPGDYRWSGYAEAMTGKAEAIEGIVAITGATAEAVQGRAPGAEAVTETPAQEKRRRLKALVMYRQLLGIAGRPRQTEDGRIVKRGISEKVQTRLAQETGVAREQLLRRVKHFTRGVVIGSKAFVDEWLEHHRPWLSGASAENRKTGARRISKDWKHLHNLRQLQV